MTAEYRARMWFAVAHSLIAVPAWGWLYAVKGLWLWGVFTVIHAVILGLALGVLFGQRLAERTVR